MRSCERCWDFLVICVFDVAALSRTRLTAANVQRVYQLFQEWVMQAPAPSAEAIRGAALRVSTVPLPDSLQAFFNSRSDEILAIVGPAAEPPDNDGDDADEDADVDDDDIDAVNGGNVGGNTDAVGDPAVCGSSDDDGAVDMIARLIRDVLRLSGSSHSSLRDAEPVVDVTEFVRIFELLQEQLHDGAGNPLLPPDLLIFTGSRVCFNHEVAATINVAAVGPILWQGTCTAG